MEKYKIGPINFIFPPGKDSNLPSNSTVKSLFAEITYKLSEDFSIGISGDLSKPKPLKVGRNEIKEKGFIWSLQVKENPTNTVGMCYIIVPDQLFIRDHPYIM